METYSEPMEAALRRQLRRYSTHRLRQLLAHFDRRGGPGFVLLHEILASRTARQAA